MQEERPDEIENEMNEDVGNTADRTRYYMPFDKVAGNPPSRSDDDIRRDIESGLFYDNDVRAIQIKTDVQNGLVTLSGTVDSDAQKLKAEAIAAHVPGVKRICNSLSTSTQ